MSRTVFMFWAALPAHAFSPGVGPFGKGAVRRSLALNSEVESRAVRASNLGAEAAMKAAIAEARFVDGLQLLRESEELQLPPAAVIALINSCAAAPGAPFQETLSELLGAHIAAAILRGAAAKADRAAAQHEAAAQHQSFQAALNPVLWRDKGAVAAALILAVGRAVSLDAAVALSRSLASAEGAPIAAVASCRDAAVRVARLQADWRVCVSEASDALKKSLPRRGAALSDAMLACGAARRADAALDLLEEAVTAGSADSFVFGAAMSACEASRDWKSALAVAVRMRASGLELNELCYKVLCAAYEHTKQPERALKTLRELQALQTTEQKRPNRSSSQSKDSRRPAKSPTEVAARVLEAHSSVASVLAKSGRWEEALQVFSELRACGALAMALRKRPAAAAKAYASAIDACRQGGDHKTAVALLRAMAADGLLENIAVYNSAISACAKAGDLTTATSLMTTAKRSSNPALAPDRYTYSAVITAAAQAGSYKEALAFLREMQAARLSPDAVVYGACLFACRSGKWEIALELLEEMEQAGVQLDTRAYIAAMAACNAAKQWQRSLQVWERLRQAENTCDGGLSNSKYVRRKRGKERRHQRGSNASARPVRADEYAYSAAIQAYAIARRHMPAVQLLRDMERRGVTPNAVCYGAAINACSRAGRWDRALQLLTEMRRRLGPPTAEAATAAIAACCSGGRMDKALAILADMVADGVRPNDLTFATVIRACAHGGDWQQALRMMDAMRRRGIRVSHRVYAAAISAAGDAGDWEGALSLLDSAKERDGLEADVIMQTAALSALKACGRGAEALSLLRSIAEPNVYSYTAAVGALVAAGRQNDAFDLLRDMRLKGVRMNGATYVEAIQACRRRRQWLFVLGFLEEMPSQGLRKTLPVVTAACDVLAASNQAHLATDVFRDAVDSATISPWSAREAGVLDVTRFSPAVAAAALRCCLEDMKRPDGSHYAHSANSDLVIALGHPARHWSDRGSDNYFGTIGGFKASFGIGGSLSSSSSRSGTTITANGASGASVSESCLNGSGLQLHEAADQRGIAHNKLLWERAVAVRNVVLELFEIDVFEGLISHWEEDEELKGLLKGNESSGGAESIARSVSAASGRRGVRIVVPTEAIRKWVTKPS